MRRLKTTRRFERDLKRAKRRGKDLDRLWTVVERLLTGKPRDRGQTTPDPGFRLTTEGGALIY